MVWICRARGAALVLGIWSYLYCRAWSASSDSPGYLTNGGLPLLRQNMAKIMMTTKRICFFGPYLSLSE